MSDDEFDGAEVPDDAGAEFDGAEFDGAEFSGEFENPAPTKKQRTTYNKTVATASTSLFCAFIVISNIGIECWTISEIFAKLEDSLPRYELPRTQRVTNPSYWVRFFFLVPLVGASQDVALCVCVPSTLLFDNCFVFVMFSLCCVIFCVYISLRGSFFFRTQLSQLMLVLRWLCIVSCLPLFASLSRAMTPHHLRSAV